MATSQDQDQAPVLCLKENTGLSYLLCPKHDILKAYYCSWSLTVYSYCSDPFWWFSFSVVNSEVIRLSCMCLMVKVLLFPFLMMHSCSMHWTHVQEQPVLFCYMSILMLSVLRMNHLCLQIHSQISLCVLSWSNWKPSWWIKMNYANSKKLIEYEHDVKLLVYINPTEWGTLLVQENDFHDIFILGVYLFIYMPTSLSLLVPFYVVIVIVL